VPSKLSEADKFDLQQYITHCYGSLTTFNILFKNKNDQFRTSAVDSAASNSVETVEAMIGFAFRLQVGLEPQSV
jgi:hypothetical protein